MSIKRNYIALRPSAPNAWERLAQPDSECIGSFIQNQETVANFWISPRMPSSNAEGQVFYPGAAQYDDLLPWQDELWVKTDTAGAALSFGRIYKNQN